jgi:hypothetical protein
MAKQYSYFRLVIGDCGAIDCWKLLFAISYAAGSVHQQLFFMAYILVLAQLLQQAQLSFMTFRKIPFLLESRLNL